MRRGIQAAAVAATLGLALPAAAYLLPAGSLLRKALARRDEVGVKTMKADGTLVLRGAWARALAAKAGRAADVDELSVAATATYKLPGRCRLELSLPGSKLALTAQGSTTRAPKELEALQPLLALACPLVSARGGDEGASMVAGALRGFGVDFKGVTFARKAGAIAEVIGAEPKNASAPALWVEKDGFSFLQLTGKLPSGTWELQLADASPASGAEQHPRFLELAQLGEKDGARTTLARFDVEKTEVGLDLADGSF